jgi:hypothetical protein
MGTLPSSGSKDGTRLQSHVYIHPHPSGAESLGYAALQIDQPRYLSMTSVAPGHLEIPPSVKINDVFSLAMKEMPLVKELLRKGWENRSRSHCNSRVRCQDEQCMSQF